MTRSSLALSLRLPQNSHLGNWVPHPCSFPEVDAILEEFMTSPLNEWTEHKKIEKINLALLGLIQKTATPCFLLPCVLDFINQVEQKKVVSRYTFTTFELFLNEFSEISEEENYKVRSKIVGKWIPRERYQDIFPVATGKHYAGSHFVTAHSSPDLDTTVASFWGWMDAFGCRISEGLHVWNVPGGPPEGQVEIGFLFYQIFGPNMFQHIAKTRSSLGITGLNLMTQKGMTRKNTGASAREMHHHHSHDAIVLTDDEGFYVGDWHNLDIEGVQQVVTLLGNSLHWFSHHLQSAFISLFSKPELYQDDVRALIQKLCNLQLSECRPIQSLTEKQRDHLQAFLRKVLKVEAGVTTTFVAFAQNLEKLNIQKFHESLKILESLASSDLFDSGGKLVENRVRIFQFFEKVVETLDDALQGISRHVDQLAVALNIKTQVFGHHPQSVSSRADLEEIRSKMGTYPYLTVTGSDLHGSLTPLGIIHASQLFRPILGTVTLRDFCNRDETRIPSYLEVISVIDHHKSALQTSSAPVVTISNAQSSNSMVAELAFSINDRFSMAGMTFEDIARQLNQAMNTLSTPAQKRILQRVLQRQMTADRKEGFFIHPAREFVEYLHFLYAILDDTDLLTKVSARDVECVASLINRLKSLTVGEEIEAVNFDDLARDDKFVGVAAQRLLQNEELYSLYHKVYKAKEDAVEANILLCRENKPSSLFADTKVQNGCCRVGQSKMFAKNFPVFEMEIEKIRAFWVKEAQIFYRERPDCDLHLHMISTLAGAEDLFHGTTDEYQHRDQLWIWIPLNDSSIGHLKNFLNGFRSLSIFQSPLTEVEFLGKHSQELGEIFNESFLPVPCKIAKNKIPDFSMAILYFPAGAINSRKAQISPYLPKLVT